MKRQQSYIEHVAERLIELDRGLEKRDAILLGSGNPFGSRWLVRAGTENLLTFKSLRRNVSLHEIHKEGSQRFVSEFSRLYPAARDGLPTPRLLEIFAGIGDVTISPSIVHNDPYVGRTEVVLESALTPAPSSADLGRMMLVDELLWNQGFHQDRNMKPEDADRVLTQFQ